MIILESQQMGFRISTTDLFLSYTESSGVKIIVDALEFNTLSNDYFKLEFYFPIVAEAKCITMNFYEANYNDFIINKNHSSELESGFYEVINSIILKEKEKTYDPKNRLALKHYIIAGYDSYIELFSSGYSIQKIN